MTEDLPDTLDPVNFVILCAERTGSTMLSDLLNSHPECLAVGELFNPRLIEGRHIPIPVGAFPYDHDELVDMRTTNPAAFIQSVFAGATLRGYRAAGFKFMYNHADAQTVACDYIVSHPQVRIIHLKRRNLLRRLLSEKRARVTNVWAERIDEINMALPAVELPFLYTIGHFEYLERRAAAYEQRLEHHLIIELFYEDLAANPQEVGCCALAFLGLSAPNAPLDVRFRKTGTDSLRDAITNYDTLKAEFLRWMAFFEE